MLQSSSHEQVASRSCPLILSFPHDSHALGSDSKETALNEGHGSIALHCGMAHAAQGAWKWDDDTSVTGVTDGKEGAHPKFLGRKVRLESHRFPRFPCLSSATATLY